MRNQILIIWIALCITSLTICTTIACSAANKACTPVTPSTTYTAMANIGAPMATSASIAMSSTY